MFPKRSGQQVLDGIASSRKPIVAAIQGSCLGGGLEVLNNKKNKNSPTLSKLFTFVITVHKFRLRWHAITE